MIQKVQDGSRRDGKKGEVYMGTRIITIGRQFGSGGRRIGERVAKELGIPCYDRALIEMASKEMGVDEYDLERVDESAVSRFFSLHKSPSYTESAMDYGLPLNDNMFLIQSQIIMKLALKEDCVIIGRCADYVLRDHPGCISVFICASKEDRKKRIMDRYELSERDALDAIKKVDRKRKYYYETYTDNNWGSIDSHQVLMNVSLLGEDEVVRLIKDMYLDK